MSNNIKKARIEAGLTQDELAAKLGTTRQNISLYENGKTEPKLSMWQKLAEILDVSPFYLQGADASTELNRVAKAFNISSIDTKEAEQYANENDINISDAILEMTASRAVEKIESSSKISPDLIKTFGLFIYSMDALQKLLPESDELIELFARTRTRLVLELANIS